LGITTRKGHLEINEKDLPLGNWSIQKGEEMIKKVLEIVAILVIIAILIFVGYMGYNLYNEWRNKNIENSKEQEILSVLEANKGIIIKLSTEIADIEKRIVTDTMKEVTVIKEEAPTYEAKKEELIELRKDEEANKEQIEVARIEFESRIDEFQKSKDKILINTGDGKIVIYEDEEGNLVSLESGIKITRHRDIEELKAGLHIEKKEEKKDSDFSIGMLYSNDFTLAISYDLVDYKKFNLNVTGYDYENPKIGLDIAYDINDRFEIGAGVGLLDLKGMKIMDEKEFYVKFGIKF